jgi:hypothetical protein
MVAMSSLFVESTSGEMELRISLATNDQPDSSNTWTASFDVDLGFLAAFHEKLRVTHLMSWPMYPACAFTRDGQVPEDEGSGQGAVGFAEGTPMWCVKKEYPEIKFVKVSKQYYCE